jgi:radical SAM protein with 4Fe4S-binding SPASM domain
MELSPFVAKSDKYFVNAVSLQILPLDATEEQLLKEGFLKGSEYESIMKVVMAPPADLTIQVMATYECNLRCKQCFILPRLVAKQDIDIEPEPLADFISRWDQRYPEKRKTINFLGGEPTLRSSNNLKVIEAVRSKDMSGIVRFSMSTNLVKDLEPVDLQFLGSMDMLQVSMDGNEIMHNRLRKASLRVTNNPYHKTLDNIKRLLNAGIDFQVSASVDKETMSMEMKEDYFRNLLEVGVPFNRILWGHYYPTENAPSSPGNEGIIPMPNPCCCFRFMRFMAVEYGDKLCTDFYNADGYLGTTRSSIEEVETKYVEFIKAKLRVLHDPICSTCPYLGQCWGGCVSHRYSKVRPSDFCNQANIDKVSKSRDFIVNNIETWYKGGEDARADGNCQV